MLKIRPRLFFLLFCLMAGFAAAGTVFPPRGVEDISPCYSADVSRCKIVDYVSSSQMPMDGDLEFTGGRAECFYADGNAYLMFQSNAPDQIVDSVFWNGTSRCYSDSLNCGNIGVAVKIPVYSSRASGRFFHSCVKTESTPNGCKPVKKGLEILVSDKNKLLVVTRRGLFFYFDATGHKGLNDFMNWRQKLEIPDSVSKSLPFNLKGEDAVAAGDRFAPKLRSMGFYLRNKKVESKKFEAGQFKSFDDLMGVCKEWGRTHENP